MGEFPEINWSAVAREAIKRKVEQLESLKRFASESELTEEDALRLGREVNKAVAKKFRELNEGKTAELLFSEGLELAEHKPGILEKTHRSVDEFEKFLSILFERVEEAKSISPDPDDVPYFALALKLGCSIWSNSAQAELERLIRKHPEIKWTEVARQAMLSEAEKLQKLEILRKFVEKEQLSDEDFAWMDEHDWHPVDEKQLRPEFVEESLRISREGKFRKVKNISDLFK